MEWSQINFACLCGMFKNLLQFDLGINIVVQYYFH